MDTFWELDTIWVVSIVLSFMNVELARATHLLNRKIWPYRYTKSK